MSHTAGVNGQGLNGHSAKDLRRLGRLELLDLLTSLSEENERLRAENERLRAEEGRLRAQLDERRIEVAESGTLAEAALKVNGFFDAAQAAADQYLENARATLAEAQAEADRIVAAARQQAFSAGDSGAPRGRAADAGQDGTGVIGRD